MRGWNEVHGVACAVCHAPTDAEGGIFHKPGCTDEARMAFVNEWRENRITKLEDALQAVMARLADLLDSDQFNNIEAIVLAAGVPYPPLQDTRG